MKNYKTMIAPFIAVIAITLQLVLGIELPQELQNDMTSTVASVVAIGAVVYGIFKNHFAEKK